jgi:hypothetical protein
MIECYTVVLACATGLSIGWMSVPPTDRKLMFFGAGCLIVEHADNTWWHAQSNTSDDEDQPKVGLAETEPVKGNSGRPTLANRRLIK